MFNQLNIGTILYETVQIISFSLYNFLTTSVTVSDWRLAARFRLEVPATLRVAQ
jgi:hypothetical protein